VVIIAKNKIAASVLSYDMQNEKIKKEYLALCHGTPESLKNVIDAPIARKEGSTIMRVVDPSGKRAVTEYEVIKSMENYSLIRVNPITGRTHQIRVHLSHIGCPIYGDDMYGSPLKNERTRLHCRKIEFLHPLSGGKMSISAEIPGDFNLQITL